MVLRENKLLVVFINFLGWFLFFPLALNKLLTRKYSLFPQRILVVEHWGIGDLITMSPILKPLKESFPHAKITLLCKPFGEILFKNNPYIDEFIMFDFPWTRFSGKYIFWKWDWKGLFRIIKVLRKQQFDLILDARGDIRNNALSFFIGANRRIGYNYTGGGYFLTDVVPWEYAKRSRIDSWLNLLNYMDVITYNSKPTLQISDNEKIWADEFLSSYNVNNTDLLIGIHPGARIKTRCWPLDRFAKVAEHIRDNYKAKIIVFIEPGGYGNNIPIEGEFIKANVPLRELIALLKRLHLLICNDAGAMHIAASLGTPILAIFGPTHQLWFGPYISNASNSLISSKGINCRPCFDHCKYKEPLCLKKISVSEVLGLLDSKIANMTHIK